MSRRLIAGALTGAMTLMIAAEAGVQDGQARFTLGGGGISLPFHGDLDFDAPAGKSRRVGRLRAISPSRRSYRTAACG